MQSEASCSLNHDATTSFRFAHTPIFQNWAPTPHWYYSVRVNPYTHSQHIKVLKHIIYIQYGCGMQSEASCSLNHDTPASFGFAQTPIFQNLAPTPLRNYSVRVNPYVHSQHIKVLKLKHFVYIQYECEMQSL
jgi:hypothetical protein